MAITAVDAAEARPTLPQVELIDTDGEPLESEWHRLAMNVLIESLKHHLRHRDDFYAGGNMFIYFSEEQARNRDFRGPDFFFVDHVNRHPMRPYWAVWQKGGRYPDVIIELLSPRTAVEDRTTKKAIYERVFHTAEYYCYDPSTEALEGWRLECSRYQPIQPNEDGWLWSSQLELWIGAWIGTCFHYQATWLCFYDTHKQVVLLPDAAEHQQAEEARQQAEEARQQADVERQRAEAAQAELARLRATLAQLQSKEPDAE